MITARHEHFLLTEGPFNDNWLEPVDTSIKGQRAWRFPYLLDFAGQIHQRVLEVSERVETAPNDTAAFVGRLTTGWLVTVTKYEESYAIHLALELGNRPQETSTMLAEAERITAGAVPEMASV